MARILAILLVVCLVRGAVGDEKKAVPAEERICGPRCAAFIESGLGKKLSVSEAVKRLQWPDISTGCSMADLRDLFREDGLQTTTATIARGELPEITGPAVVAIEKLEDLDHFVVVLQATPGNSVKYWDGLEGIHHEEPSRFWSRARPQVLLVGTQPPVVSRAATRSTVPLVNRILMIGGGLVIFGLTCRVLFRFLVNRRVSNAM